MKGDRHILGKTIAVAVFAVAAMMSSLANDDPVDPPVPEQPREGIYIYRDCFRIIPGGMPQHAYEVSGTSYPFVFEFCNWYQNMVLNSHTWYGYISLGLDENAELAILESAICNEQNELLVNGSDVVEPPDPFVDPATGCETNTFYATSESTPHILHSRDSAFDFVIFIKL